METQYVYIKSEPYLYTVGFYHNGKWNPESDHETTEKASKRVSFLNGNTNVYSHEELVKALSDCLEEINQLNRKLGNLTYTEVEKLAKITLNKVTDQ